MIFIEYDVCKGEPTMLSQITVYIILYALGIHTIIVFVILELISIPMSRIAHIVLNVYVYVIYVFINTMENISRLAYLRLVVPLMSVDQLDPITKVIVPEKLMSQFASLANGVRTWEVPRSPEIWIVESLSYGNSFIL